MSSSCWQARTFPFLLSFLSLLDFFKKIEYISFHVIGLGYITLSWDLKKKTLLVLPRLHILWTKCYSFQLYYIVISVSQLANSLTIDALQLIAFQRVLPLTLSTITTSQFRKKEPLALLCFKPLHFYQPFMFPCKCENRLVIPILKFLL